MSSDIIDLDIGGTNFKDKPDMSLVWLRHMIMTNQSASNPELYDANVRQMFRLLPDSWRTWVMQQSDLYSKEEYYFEYENRFGRTIGNEHDPSLHNDLIPVKRLEDDSIDWDDPNIFSPKRKTRPVYNYEQYNHIVLSAAEKAGLSWKTEPTNSEYGLYPAKEEDLGTKTPLLGDPKKNELPAQNILRRMSWINYKGIAKRVANFRGFACGIGDDEKPWFFNEIAHRQIKQEPIVILITATQGKGKTYCGLRLAEIFDKKFNPEYQVAMDRSQITKLVSGRGTLKRNQCIVIDESQFGANARSWGDKNQQALMNFLSAARFYGYIIIIVALHRGMLDSIIRDRIINFHIHMEGRGIATVYQTNHSRFDEKNYPRRRGKLVLQLPDYDECDWVTCLDCKKKPECGTLRARYERVKTEFVQSQAEKRELLENVVTAKETTDAEYLEMVTPGWGNSIRTDVNVDSIESDITKYLKDVCGVSGVSKRLVVRLRKLLKQNAA